MVPPPADYLAPSPHRVAPEAPPQPAKPKSDLPPLRLPLGPLMAAWPDEIKGELAALNGSACVLLPAEEITAGLARGKVVFTWGELRACIEPALESASAVDDATPLALPLKFCRPGISRCVACAKTADEEGRGGGGYSRDVFERTSRARAGTAAGGRSCARSGGSDGGRNPGGNRARCRCATQVFTRQR